MDPAWAQRHSWRPTVSLIDEADHDEANETEDRGGIEAKIALEALREEATVGDLAQRHAPTPFYAWKRQLQDQETVPLIPASVGTARKHMSARSRSCARRSGS